MRTDYLSPAFFISEMEAHSCTARKLWVILDISFSCAISKIQVHHYIISKVHYIISKLYLKFGPFIPILTTSTLIQIISLLAFNWSCFHSCHPPIHSLQIARVIVLEWKSDCGCPSCRLLQRLPCCWDTTSTCTVVSALHPLGCAGHTSS